MVQRHAHESRSESSGGIGHPKHLTIVLFAKLLETLIPPCSENDFRLIQDLKD